MPRCRPGEVIEEIRNAPLPVPPVSSTPSKVAGCGASIEFSTWPLDFHDNKLNVLDGCPLPLPHDLNYSHGELSHPWKFDFFRLTGERDTSSPSTTRMPSFTGQRFSPTETDFFVKLFQIILSWSPTLLRGTVVSSALSVSRVSYSSTRNGSRKSIQEG